MSLTSRIPDDLRASMAADPFYSRCCVTGRTDGKIDWHHNLTWAGKRVNEAFCILPLAREIHDQVHRYKDRCDWIMWSRATPEELTRYSKARDARAELARLNETYGHYDSRPRPV